MIRSSSGDAILVTSKILGRRAAESHVVMAGRRAPAIVEPAARHAELLSGIVVAGAPQDHGPYAGPALASVGVLVGIRLEDGGCPLAEVPHHVLHAVRAGAARAAVHGRGRVVGPAE